jgi:hypothetical protein
MTAPTPARAPSRVLSRGHRVLALLLLALAAGLAGAPVAAARSGEGRKEGAKRDRAADRDAEILDAAAKALKARDARALEARLPARAKVTLRLPGVREGEYGASQAAALLARWLEGRPFESLDRKGVKDGVGTYDARWSEGTGRGRRERRATILLTLASEGDARVLAGVREDP